MKRRAHAGFCFVQLTVVIVVLWYLVVLGCRVYDGVPTVKSKVFGSALTASDQSHPIDNQGNWKNISTKTAAYHRDIQRS